MTKVYRGGSNIVGRLSSRKKLGFTNILTRNEKTTLSLFVTLSALTSIFLSFSAITAMRFKQFSIIVAAMVTLLVLLEVIKLVQSLSLAIFAYFAKDPIPMTAGENLRIAVLTTIVPGKEPFELVQSTLQKMLELNPGKNNTVDVWLLDEGNNSDIKKACEAMGVKHFSRKGIAMWNTNAGQFKTRTKHGNHNAWRAANEVNYDIVAQMDPDHMPRSNFLTRTLGYFTDSDVAFVVAPQVYGNINESWIAKASAFQAYIFHGIIQRGGNGMNAPLLIGTNHLYRVEALRQINGYQDSIIEDHLTSMVLYGAKNAHGQMWRGVYTPDIIAVGEGPVSFTDYFNQQKRWAYGILEIIKHSTPNAVKRMSNTQTLSFMMLQFFYPSVALAWVLSVVLTVLFSTMAIDNGEQTMLVAVLYAYSVLSTLGLFYWLRRFNLVKHEQKDWGLEGMALLIMCVPIYVEAAWQAIVNKPLTYVVTAKGNLASPDSLSTFKAHYLWTTITLLGLGLIYALQGVSLLSGVLWSLEHLSLCLLPLAVFVLNSSKTVSLATIKNDFTILSKQLVVMSSRFASFL